MPGEFAGCGELPLHPRGRFGHDGVQHAYFATLSVAIATASRPWPRAPAGQRVAGAPWLVAGAVLPWAIPDIVNALMWQWIYNPTYGALNGLLVSLGVLETYRAWLSTPWSAMHAVVVAYSWKLVPFVVIILYAALRSVPPEVYESAQIDGAGRMGPLRLRQPARSSLRRSPSPCLFCVVWSMRAFDIVYLLTRGGPGERPWSSATSRSPRRFEFGDLGAGAAVACVLGAATLAMTLVYLRAAPGRGDGWRRPMGSRRAARGRPCRA